MYYVTFRLADSLPQTLLKQCQAERALWLKLNPRPWSVAVLREYARRFQVTFFAGHTALVEVLYGASAREATWDDRAVLDG